MPKLMSNAPVSSITTQMVQLSGTLRVVPVCHSKDDCASCDACLRAIARFLAEEMGYDLEAAMAKTTEQYREELGIVFCTHDQAHDLGLMTAAICYYRSRKNVVEFTANTKWFSAQCDIELAAVDEQRKLHRRRKHLWAIAAWLLFVALCILFTRAS